jgi:hypothetical protein
MRCHDKVHFSLVFHLIPQIDYSFRYYINNVDNITLEHWERRDYPDNIVRGGYGMLEPDGKIRIVQYQVSNNSGFKANIRIFKNNNIQFHRPFTTHLRQPKEPIVHIKPVNLL